MIIKLNSLLQSIDIKISNNERNYIYYLMKIAGYEDNFRQMIEDASKDNPRDFNYLFNGSDRLYIQFDGSVNDLADLSKDDKYVIYILGRLKYKTDKNDYLNGYCYEMDNQSRRIRIGKVLTKAVNKCESVLNYIASIDMVSIDDEDFRKILNLNDESIEIFKESLATSDQLNEIEPKLLVQKILEHKVTYYARLLDELSIAIEKYNLSEFRTGAHKNLTLVISQNPHDIAKASFERAWDSCWNLESGINSNCALNEAKSGGLIAYLIKKDDKNIEEPLCRLLIRKFKNKNGDIMAKVEDVVYGLEIPGFKDAVKRFIDNNVKSSNEPGTYTLHGGQYSDSYERNLIIHPPADRISSEYISSLIEDRLKFTIDNFLEMELKASTIDLVSAKSVANYGHEWSLYKIFQHPAIDNLANTADDDELVKLFHKYLLPGSKSSDEYKHLTFKEHIKISPSSFRDFLKRKIDIENLLQSADLLSQLSSKHARIVANDWLDLLSPSIVVNFERHHESQIAEIVSRSLDVNKDLVSMRLQQMYKRGFSGSSYIEFLERSLGNEYEKVLSVYEPTIGHFAAKKVIQRLNKQIAWRLSHLDVDISAAIVIFYIQSGDIKLNGEAFDD